MWSVSIVRRHRARRARRRPRRNRRRGRLCPPAPANSPSVLRHQVMQPVTVNLAVVGSDDLARAAIPELRSRARFSGADQSR
jgi:hypothetical protein